MNRIEKLGLLALFIIMVILIGIFAFLNNRQQPTITGYEDMGGWVYTCSKPIKAKQGTTGSLGHPQGLVPADESEAKQYCHSIGIE